jgi:hypothetical protein
MHISRLSLKARTFLAMALMAGGLRRLKAALGAG